MGIAIFLIGCLFGFILSAIMSVSAYRKGYQDSKDDSNNIFRS